MPRSGLRQALFKLSASPECFFAMRSNFGKSLAVMCIAHWIMGIGDRHLGNFLIDKTNGQLIGIDFNMSFGAATRNLNIPEILPFRLTKQFVEVLSPLQTSGFLQKCMIHVLRTFSLESASLMAALQFFIFEGSSAGARRSPDHSPHTRRSSTSSQDDPSYASGQSTDKECDPNDLVQTVQQKLNGVNPLYLCQCDLNVGYYSGFVFVAPQIHEPKPIDFTYFQRSTRHFSLCKTFECITTQQRHSSTAQIQARPDKTTAHCRGASEDFDRHRNRCISRRSFLRWFPTMDLIISIQVFNHWSIQ